MPSDRHSAILGLRNSWFDLSQIEVFSSPSPSRSPSPTAYASPLPQANRSVFSLSTPSTSWVVPELLGEGSLSASQTRSYRSVTCHVTLCLTLYGLSIFLKDSVERNEARQDYCTSQFAHKHMSSLLDIHALTFAGTCVSL